MKALVVGYGSIGQRHARVLEELGFEVAVVSRRPVEHPRRYDCLDTALSGWRPEYVVIASRTSEHFDDLVDRAPNTDVCGDHRIPDCERGEQGRWLVEPGQGA